jgi:hypothetical protein
MYLAVCTPQNTPADQVRQLLELNKDLTNQIIIAMVSCGLINAQVLQVGCSFETKLQQMAAMH